MKKLIALFVAFALVFVTGCDFITQILNSDESDIPLSDPVQEDASAFEYEYSEEFGGIIIRKYKGKNNNIIIPAQIDGKPVVAMGNESTTGEYQGILEDIFNEELVRVTTESVFQNKIVGVVLPDGMKVIGKAAFAQNSSLRSIIIPDSVTHIGDYAFYECDSLTQVTLPYGISGVTRAGFNKSVEISVIIPYGVTSIEEAAFLGWRQLTEVTIPDSVTVLEKSAFQNCGGLTSITLPDGLTRIERLALNGFGGTSIKIPDSVTYIGSDAFSFAELTEITLPKGITTIAELTFQGCRKLKSVVIQDGVTEIETLAFTECHALTDVFIPESVTKIDSRAFLNCIALSEESKQKILQINPEAVFRR